MVGRPQPTPLLEVPHAAKLAKMSRWVFLRYVRARAKDRDPKTGELRWPDLIQKVGPRRILVQSASLEAALGRSQMQLEAFALETSDRVDVVELRVTRLEEKIERIAR